MIKDRLDQECAVREAQDECLMFQSAGHRTAHEMRFESISKSTKEVERKSREDLKSMLSVASSKSLRIFQSRLGHA